MLLPGTPYELVRPIGAGGMGDVHEAVHVTLGVRRAVKVLKHELSGQRALLERFHREARILASVRHPCLVEVSDLGTSADGRTYLAMELLHGRTLREVLADRGALKVEHAARIASAVLDALAAVHPLGVVHRDVKPENVFLVAGGGVKLLDFGIAKLLEPEGLGELTATGASIGTPRYMSPEQARGEVVDARADVYATGAILWEMLVGAPPNADVEGAIAAARAAVDGLPRLHGFPVPIVELVFAATRPDPAARPATAAQFRTDLARALGAPLDDATTVSFSAEPTALVPSGPVSPPSFSRRVPDAEATPDLAPPRRRHVAALATFGAAATLVGLSAWAIASANQGAPAAPVSPEVVPPSARPAPPPSVATSRGDGAPTAPVVRDTPRAQASSPRAVEPAKSARPAPPRPPDELPPSGLLRR